LIEIIIATFNVELYSRLNEYIYQDKIRFFNPSISTGNRYADPAGLCSRDAAAKPYMDVFTGVLQKE